MAKFVWPDEMTKLLRELWTAGHSSAAIGKKLGVSKNSVVGKAHRLDLESRKSPIIRKTVTAPEPARQQRPIKTLPDLFRSKATVIPIEVFRPKPAPKPIQVKPPAPVPMVVTPNRAPSPYQTCQFPSGTPGRKDFRFCGGETAPGKPYCAACCVKAYVKIRDRDQDAAD